MRQLSKFNKLFMIKFWTFPQMADAILESNVPEQRGEMSEVKSGAGEPLMPLSLPLDDHFQGLKTLLSAASSKP